MKFKSHSSTNPVPYRLGVEIADKLSEIQPEVILLFTSVGLAHFEEIYSAIKDTFGDKCPIVLGGTGDGIYETHLVSDNAIAAMGINSENTIQWAPAEAPIENGETYLATENCINQLKKKLDQIDYIFTLSDFRADGAQLVKAVNELTKAKCFGGFVSDSRELSGAFTFINGKKLQSSVIMLGMKTDQEIHIFNGSGYRASGVFGTVTACNGTKISQINNQPAVHFVEGQTAKSISFIDKGVLGFNISPRNNVSGHFLRAVSDFDLDKNEIHLFGGIEEGDQIQVCSANSDDIVNGVREVIREIKKSGITPSAGLIVSCAGRKWLLGHQLQHEVGLLVEEVDENIPIAGFPSLGEISPVATQDGGFSNQFHNVTYVVAIFGEKS